MRVVLQRVSRAQVEVDGSVVGRIGGGLLVYLGVGHGDGTEQAEFIADKLVNLRIFSDDAGKMNLSVLDVGGEILMVSNFTLYGNCQKGRRPGFDDAGEPAAADALFEKVVELVRRQGVNVEKGVFGEHMHVSSINDGPVTFVIEK